MSFLPTRLAGAVGAPGIALGSENSLDPRNATTSRVLGTNVGPSVVLFGTR